MLNFYIRVISKIFLGIILSIVFEINTFDWLWNCLYFFLRFGRLWARRMARTGPGWQKWKWKIKMHGLNHPPQKGKRAWSIEDDFGRAQLKPLRVFSLDLIIFFSAVYCCIGEVLFSEGEEIFILLCTMKRQVNFENGTKIYLYITREQIKEFHHWSSKDTNSQSGKLDHN